MKFTKLSLIAALAVTSVFAGESTISGDAKLFYSTSDANNQDLFDKGGSIGDAAVSLDYSRGIADGVTLNAGVTGVSTLGLENTLVSGTWINHNGGVKDKVWLDTANITATVGKTTAVIGRQALDTPLAFTEKWNIAENTFDAAVLVNQDIPDTTLIGAWVGRGNGDQTSSGTVVNPGTGVNGGFIKYGAASGLTPTQVGGQQQATGIINNGAFAAAAITKLIPNTVAQAWYYNVRNNADAVWLQADVDATSGVTVGAQYANISPQGVVSALHDSTAYAGKLGYVAGDMDLYAAYSSVDKQSVVNVGNTATGGLHGGQSKLYTEAWWNYGFVGQPDAQTIALGAGYDLGMAKLSAQYTTVTNDTTAANEMDEIALTATTKVGPLDATVAFINTSADANTAIDGNTVQAYLTVPFSL